MKELPEVPLIPQIAHGSPANVPKNEWSNPILGTRHKLGGKPDLIQFDPSPKCPDCGEPMTFYAQLDSINDQVVIADCGLIYVYLCFGCYVSIAHVQSY
jgi:hypothetical protein